MEGQLLSLERHFPSLHSHGYGLDGVLSHFCEKSKKLLYPLTKTAHVIELFAFPGGGKGSRGANWYVPGLAIVEQGRCSMFWETSSKGQKNMLRQGGGEVCWKWSLL